MPALDIDQLLGADDFATLSVGPLSGSMQTYPYTGLSEAGAAAIILANLGRVGTPIDVTVDGSSDGGATWNELASASAVISTHTLLVDAPPDAIRVTLVGEADSVEVRLRPFRSGVSGGSQAGAVRWLGPCKVNAFAGQLLFSSGQPTGGSFTLTLAGEETAPIAWDATAAQLVAALEALPSLGAGTVALDLRNPGPAPLNFIGLVFKDAIANELMTGDGAALTGPDAPYSVSVEGSTEFLVEMFTPAIGDIIEDFLHAIPADWDDQPKLSYIDAAAVANPNNLSPGWVVPSSSQGNDVDGLDIGSDNAGDYTNFFGMAGDPAQSEQATPQLALIAEWIATNPHHYYTNLPAVVRHAVPIYSRVYNVSDAPTGGEVWIWVKVSTPAPLMD